MSVASVLRSFQPAHVVVVSLLIGCSRFGQLASEGPGWADAAPRFTDLISEDMGYCARVEDGTAWCWGSRMWLIFGLDEAGEGEVDEGWVDDWMAVKRFGPGIAETLEVSDSYLCWVDSAGTVDCAGGVHPEFSGSPVQRFFANSTTYAAILQDGSYEVGADLQRSFPPPPEFLEVEGDSVDVCYRAPGDQWTCPWGWSGRYLSLDLVFQYGCAIQPNGEVVCWDVNVAEDLVEGVPGWTKVVRSQDFACGLTSNRTVSCVAPPNPKEFQTSPWHGPLRAAREPVVDLGCTMYGSCCARLHTGELECWGFEQFSAIPTFELAAGR